MRRTRSTCLERVQLLHVRRVGYFPRSTQRVPICTHGSVLIRSNPIHRRNAYYPNAMHFKVSILVKALLSPTTPPLHCSRHYPAALAPSPPSSPLSLPRLHSNSVLILHLELLDFATVLLILARPVFHQPGNILHKPIRTAIPHP